jgi:hypothetical protein
MMIAMAKKNRQQLQRLIAKKQQLQAVQSSGYKLVVEPKAATVQPAGQPTEKPSEISAASKPIAISTEIRRTLISILIVVVLLAGSYIASRKTNYLDRTGNWLYHSLRLS